MLLKKPPNQRVLIVDPNTDCADSLRMVMEFHGQDVKAIYDATKAVETVRSFRPNLIISELALCGTDGFQLARLLSGAGLLQGTLLAACSGYCRDCDREQAAAAGFKAFLAKPASLDEYAWLLWQSARG